MFKMRFIKPISAFVSRFFGYLGSIAPKSLNSHRTAFVYADYASITPTDPRVLEEYTHCARVHIGNPSSHHRLGVGAAKVLEDARVLALKLVAGRPNEVVFTGSGTEANNLAVMGVIEDLYSRGQTYINMHVVMSSIEHSSVRALAKVLQDKGVQVSFAPVNEFGQVDLDELRKLINHRTVLVSVMMVNNEIGTIQPVKEIAKIIRAENKMRQYQNDSNSTSMLAMDHRREYLPIYFHTDASQAFVYEDVNVQQLGVDMLTLDSHKVYGPRGVGLLWINKNVKLSPIIHGGGQEFGLRSGTESLPSIVSFVFALRLANHLREMETKRVNSLKSEFINTIIAAIPETVIHGGFNPKITAPHVVNFSLPNIEHEYFAFALDSHGIFVSTRSACIKEEDDSYVLKELYKNTGKNTVQFEGSLRVSFGRFTTKSQVKKIARTIIKLYQLHKKSSVQSNQVNGNIIQTPQNGTSN